MERNKKIYDKGIFLRLIALHLAFEVSCRTLKSLIMTLEALYSQYSALKEYKWMKHKELRKKKTNKMKTKHNNKCICISKFLIHK